MSRSVKKVLLLTLEKMAQENKFSFFSLLLNLFGGWMATMRPKILSFIPIAEKKRANSTLKL